MRRVLALAIASLAGAGSAASAATPPGSYTVVLKDSVRHPGAVAVQHSGAYGAQVRFVYRHALKGYAATIPARRLAALRSDPRVVSVSPDVRVAAAGPNSNPIALVGSVGSCVLSTCQSLPVGVDRIDGDRSSARSGDGRGSVDVNVAVLDSGIDSHHPDLNVRGGINCTNGQGFGDALGHGTDVAGVIGARDNRIGVVGIAPGAPLWAVRVLNDNGSGSTSSLLCGIDWVTGSRTDGSPDNDIAVANMSLGGQGVDDGNCGRSGGGGANAAIHLAICNSTAAGVTYVAAAGNHSTDLQDFVPAAFDEVLAVTAMVDYDGRLGGTGSQAYPECAAIYPIPQSADDSAAFFSNFATLAADRDHTIAAPGVCVLSTYSDEAPVGKARGQYALMSGTSTAAPHVSGAVALCIASGGCGGLSPGQIVQKIRSDAAAYSTANPAYGFAGDPIHTPELSRYYGHLARAGLY
jgi:subtilisin